MLSKARYKFDFPRVQNDTLDVSPKSVQIVTEIHFIPKKKKKNFIKLSIKKIKIFYFHKQKK